MDFDVQQCPPWNLTVDRPKAGTFPPPPHPDKLTNKVRSKPCYSQGAVQECSTLHCSSCHGLTRGAGAATAPRHAWQQGLHSAWWKVHLANACSYRHAQGQICTSNPKFAALQQGDKPQYMAAAATAAVALCVFRISTTAMLICCLPGPLQSSMPAYVTTMPATALPLSS